jgi:ankyrin repeat protein
VACIRESASVLGYLADKGADLNLLLHDECTPLQLVAQRGKLPMIKLLLELGADINGKPGEEGSTIHYALLSRDESVVRFALENGALVDDSSPNNSTLCKAIQFNLTNLVPLLLEKGADVNKESGNWTPVSKAFSRKRKELVKLLIDHGATFADAGPEVLLETVRSRPLAEIKELLDYGIDPNCHDNYNSPIGVSFTCV